MDDMPFRGLRAGDAANSRHRTPLGKGGKMLFSAGGVK
jgi:hypothetical protein